MKSTKGPCGAPSSFPAESGHDVSDATQAMAAAGRGARGGVRAGGPPGARRLGCRATTLPTLYVNYSQNCTFTMTDDAGNAVGAIAPGTYQVEVQTPGDFGAVDLNGITDMTACRGFVQFQLTGPGVSIETTLDDGDSDFALATGVFRPNATYTAVDENQPSVARVVFTTNGSTAGPPPVTTAPSADDDRLGEGLDRIPRHAARHGQRRRDAHADHRRREAGRLAQVGALHLRGHRRVEDARFCALGARQGRRRRSPRPGSSVPAASPSNSRPGSGPSTRASSTSGATSASSAEAARRRARGVGGREKTR